MHLPVYTDVEAGDVPETADLSIMGARLADEADTMTAGQRQKPLAHRVLKGVDGRACHCIQELRDGRGIDDDGFLEGAAKSRRRNKALTRRSPQDERLILDDSDLLDVFYGLQRRGSAAAAALKGGMRGMRSHESGLSRRLSLPRAFASGTPYVQARANMNDRQRQEVTRRRVTW